MVDPANWVPANEMKPFKTFKFSGVGVNPGEPTPVLNGEIKNENNYPFDMVEIEAVFRDKRGRIVFGCSGSIDNRLGAGSSMPFQIDTMGSIPDYAKIEMYATPM